MKVLLALTVLVASAVAAPGGLYQAAYIPFPTNFSYVDSSLRIVDGQNAVRNQFPYQISLQLRQLTSWNHICGGSIISSNWILTAARCTSSFSASQLRVVAGILRLNDANIAGQQTRAIKKIFNHLLYPGGSLVSPNDIALIQLASSLQFSVNVQPINIPKQGHTSHGYGTLSGWGLTGSDGSVPNNLQFAVLPVVEQSDCLRALRSFIGDSGNIPFNSQLNICSGNAQRRESACSGDSGGPFVEDGRVVGIVSWGIVPCGTSGAPSVYTKTSAYTSWIISTTHGEVRPEN